MDKKSNLKIYILLSIMCLFLTMGIVIQINTVKNSTTTIGKTLVENKLRDSVLRWKQKYENAYERLEQKESQINDLRERVSNLDDSHGGLIEKLDNYNALLGNTELIGKGIIITLKDGNSNLLKGSVSDILVHDADLYEVVNALKNCGAEAISINGQRIVNGTEINCSGNIISINGEKIGVPFVIKAIGLPSRLYGSLTMAGGYLDILQNEGVSVDVVSVDKETIIIPKYTGVHQFEYATSIEE